MQLLPLLCREYVLLRLGVYLWYGPHKKFKVNYLWFKKGMTEAGYQKIYSDATAFFAMPI